MRSEGGGDHLCFLLQALLLSVYAGLHKGTFYALEHYIQFILL
jgi:hypothetical protein